MTRTPARTFGSPCLRSAMLLFTLLALAHLPLPAQGKPAAAANGPAWVFAGFRTDSKDGVYFALSLDGYHWKLANNGQPVVHQTEKDELMRDPFLQRTPDNKFVMVWTWGWTGNTLGISTSDDMVHWTAHRPVVVMGGESAVRNTWAPAIYWNKDKKNWLIFWSSTIPGRFAGDDAGDNGLNHRIWSTTSTDLKTFTPAKVFFDPGFSVIDATLIATPEFAGAPWHLIFKDERKTPLRKFLQTASGPTMEGPWKDISEPLSEPWSEGAAIIRVPGGFLAYYDHYRPPQHYGAAFTADFKHWADAADKIDFPAGMRHGSFLQITRAEYDRLLKLGN